MKYPCQEIELEPESDQASRSNYQFTGNTEDRETDETIPWGCSQKNLGFGEVLRTQNLFFSNKYTVENNKNKRNEKGNQRLIAIFGLYVGLDF